MPDVLMFLIRSLVPFALGVLIGALIGGVVMTGVCWDEAGKVIGMAGAGGKPAIEVPLDLLGAAASIAGPIGAAVILGRGVQEAVKRLPASTTTITIPPPSAP